MGASKTYLIPKGLNNEENAKAIVALFSEGRQPDVTVECSGAESSVCTGILATRYN